MFVFRFFLPALLSFSHRVAHWCDHFISLSRTSSAHSKSSHMANPSSLNPAGQFPWSPGPRESRYVSLCITVLLYSIHCLSGLFHTYHIIHRPLSSPENALTTPRSPTPTSMLHQPDPSLHHHVLFQHHVLCLFTLSTPLPTHLHCLLFLRRALMFSFSQKYIFFVATHTPAPFSQYGTSCSCRSHWPMV